MKNYSVIFKNYLGFLKNIDFVVLFLALILAGLGLSIIYEFEGNNVLFYKQLSSLGFAVLVFFATSFFVNIYFFKNNRFIYLIFFFSVGLLIALMFFGVKVSGARSWFDLGFFSFQPTVLAKFALILILAKYFSKRHIEIARFKHLIISGLYMMVFFILLLIQPDLGSAMIIFFIWFAFILVAGVPKKYILGFLILGLVISALAYQFVLKDYQQARIHVFFNPTLDRLGIGWNINQANIAFGSGELIGKGISDGTQARLGFLPQAKTDFILSAYAEEWGFIGVLVLFFIFSVFILRLVVISMKGRTNFESLLGAGIVIYFATHFFVHSGINLGFLPVTGTTMPFMSYGGSHLLISFFILGIMTAIAKTNRQFHRSDLKDRHIIG